ncbi:NDP-sugar pyrophosphorylase family protein [Parabacteroides sp. PF5-5]|uniref:nucleotidyltransferase family protein n=1 Tax=unclassified Parabacteroides TaxID=2649774 RepID=UPI0024735E98|nr:MULTISPECIES: NDP-sugar synthase [unclassified Parabacteroides]MDH6304447.1 NDP-sugar pyrophosphorylase family protein [Parabacteroides sp. PH5-39]MDH6315400.1 NDP-sugar pyrophosphorylase family protein [Parabacteroides sp. PF5-13]MDH6319106.1 NDP-sugar pyrophosphorylase family protein [Parabacteroides sp. PH5-13]MDH6322836.1 NDP-sugar pyrophosphorylase family protein [Parabacteroides sp. PH5-8]MDH6326592.1 NDP-sugar pyrophosphorylase family protein [Parabacteroides sp. PH5-41]
MDYAIIAAGEGSRLVQEGIKCPKPLVRLNGITLIDRLIDVFLDNGATSINVIINEEMKEVQEHMQSKKLSVPFHLIIKSTPSSMHSFYELSRYLTGERFCLTTVDTIFREEEFKEYIRTFETEKESDGLMAVTDYIDDEKPLYVNVDQDLSVVSFSDKAEVDSRYVSGGIYCLKRSALTVLERAVEQGVSRMRNYQRSLIEEGLKLKAYPFSKIVDVDHAEDIAKAEQFLNV